MPLELAPIMTPTKWQCHTQSELPLGLPSSAPVGRWNRTSQGPNPLRHKRQCHTQCELPLGLPSSAPVGRWNRASQGLRHKSSIAALMAVLLLITSSWSQAQEPDPLDAALVVQKAVVKAIADTEDSVVALARARKADDSVKTLLKPPAGDRAEGAGGLPFEPTEFATGVVVDSDGYILTCRHVLGYPEQNDYYVWINGEPKAAHVLAADGWFDLAVLKVDAVGLSVPKFGDGGAVSKGEFVVALGNPHAILKNGGPSATWGMVSNRSMPAPAAPENIREKDLRSLYQDGGLLQTDAKLDLATSGGVLVNLKGEVIALTTMFAIEIGYEASARYAAPFTARTQRAVETLKSGRTIDAGFLGISLPEPGQQLGRGIPVGGAGAGMPAAAAGIERDDVITHIGGVAVKDVNKFRQLVASYQAGDVVAVKYERRRAKRTATVTLAKRPPYENYRTSYQTSKPPVWRGLHVDYCTVVADTRDVNFDPRGSVVIVSVDEDSPAARAGLRPRQFISAIEGVRVTTPADFHKAAKQLTGSVAVRLFESADGEHLKTIEPE